MTYSKIEGIGSCCKSACNLFQPSAREPDPTLENTASGAKVLLIDIGFGTYHFQRRWSCGVDDHSAFPSSVPEPILISQTNPSSRPCVLVVEDEIFCRFHAVDLVEAAGYRAIEASNADEAIAILEARKDIRIVFTDIDMPGSMDGLKLARAIRDRWPPIELILTSGQSMCRRAKFQREVYSSRSHIGIKR